MKYVEALCYAIFGFLIGLICMNWYKEVWEKGPYPTITDDYTWRRNHYILTDRNLYTELLAQDIDSAKLIVAIAIKETNSFSSYDCRIRNNLFNYKNEGKTVTFPHWSSAIVGYEKYLIKYKRDTTYKKQIDIIYKNLNF